MLNASCYLLDITEKSEDKNEREGESDTICVDLPPEVYEIIYGKDQSRWLREAVSAYREVLGPIHSLTEALIAASTDNSAFSYALLCTLMVSF